MLQNDLMGFNRRDNSRVYATLKTSSTSIANAANTSPVFTEKMDPYNLVHPAGNFGFVIKKEGLYFINYNISYVAGGGNNRHIRLFINNIQVIDKNKESNSVNSQWNLSIQTHRILKVGDFVQAVAYQDSGGAISLNGSPDTCNFEIVEVSY